MSGARLLWVSTSLLLSACTALHNRPPPRGPETEPPKVVSPVERGKPPQETNAGRYSMKYDTAPDPRDIPENVAKTPDAVPRVEPKSRSGNAAQYTVFGQRYQVMDDAAGYRERGGASWYGRKFHGHLTASGERYDMFEMTAAHKSLPLPTYVRVTNLSNGRAVIVRVNDRGPFHPGRIIDLSYAAAARLDMIAAGQAKVEVEAIVPDAEPLHRPHHSEDPGAAGYFQVGSFLDPINAVHLRAKLLEADVGPAAIWIDDEGEVAWHRVVVGPFSDERSATNARTRLERRGLTPRWTVP